MNEMSMQGTLSAAERSVRSVFVGNIPYEATEEQLKDIFSEVGPVVSFRLVYDRETGKPKGYGFCEYKDQDTALSAMRNLNGYELNGRALRVDNAASEKNKEELKNLQASLGGPPVESPYGPECDPEKAPEAISKAVASLPPEQMFELMKQMKLCIQNNLIEARNMLLQNPQLAYALLQAQVVMRIVEPQVAMGMLHRPNTAIEPIMPAGGPAVEQGMGPSHLSNMSSNVGNHQVGPPQQPQQQPPPPPPNNFNDMHFAGGNMGANQMGPRGAGQPSIPRHILLDRPEPQQRGGMGMNQMADPRGPAGGRDYDMRDARGNLLERDPRAGGMPMSGQHMMGGGSSINRDPRGDPREQPPMRADPRGEGRAISHDADPRSFDPRARGGVADPRTQRGPVDFDPRGGPQGGFDQRGGPAAFPDRSGFDQRSPIYDQRDPRSQGPPGRAQPGPPMGRPGPMGGGAPIASQDQEKAALIMQVLQLSDQQIAMLPPEQRQSIMVLKEQIARTAQNQ